MEGKQRGSTKCCLEGPSKRVSSATDPQDAVSLCANSALAPGGGQVGTCVTVTTGTGETEAQGSEVIFLMSYS